MQMKPIWIPTQEQVVNANITKFIDKLAIKTEDAITDYWGLHKYSVENSAQFWRDIATFCGALGDFSGRGLTGDKIIDANWFPDAQLNYAETMLKRRDDQDAIVFRGEDKVQEKLSFAELYEQVSQMILFLKSKGVRRGDRVAGFVPNHPSAVIAMLATASLGAIWSSCSPDFGGQGVIDRFGQIEPKLIFVVDGYFYNGKQHDCTQKIKSFLTELPSVSNVVMIEYIQSYQKDIKNCVTFSEALSGFEPNKIEFEQVSFDQPLFILYSSGTTGAPKCIVHGHGGTLLQHLKEHQLHTNLNKNDRLFYFSTCSWMMWNWLVSGLASGVTIMLYDGSPFYPGPEVLWDYAQDEKFTVFGTSAKYLEALQKADYIPKKHDLSSLKSIASTGSPLSAEGYDFVYESIKSDIHLASISGGTDIVSCFVLGVPTLPVYRGEIQAPGLGMNVDVWDADGNSLKNERGELVCKTPFPSRPVSFWRDEGRKKYYDAYFDSFENVWAHGDFAEINDRGGVVIHGRSDATLNPGGVRIGTAEIYRQVDKVSSVLESVVIGQDWQNDVRVVLFVKMKEGVSLNDEIRQEIKTIIKTECTPRHVPAVILEVPDIPRTKSGKIVEIPVRDVVHGREIKNIEALANAEALDYFKDRDELS